MKVTIIGAGIIGCAVAYELASRGAAVQLLDGRGVGMGATRASAGILAPRIEGHSDPLLRLGTCSLSVYDEFVSRVRADSSEPFEYERCGTLQVALSAAEVDDLQDTAARLQALDVPHTLIDGSAIGSYENALSHQTRAALLLPDHGYVVPDGFARALAEAAARRGARLLTTRVESVQGGDRFVDVATTAGTLHSDVVVVASGSWASELRVNGALPVKPIRGQLLHLRTPGRMASRVIWGPRCYLVPWADGSVLVGATAEDAGFDESATAGGVLGLLAAAVELMPGLERARFSEVRVGLRPMIADELPVVGRSSTKPRLVYAIGHYRNGVLLAPLTALMVADLVMDGRERPEMALTRPDRLGL